MRVRERKRERERETRVRIHVEREERLPVKTIEVSERRLTLKVREECCKQKERED